MSMGVGEDLARLQTGFPKLDLDLTTVRAILGPHWSSIAEGFIATRAYDNGVEAAFRLLEAVERYEDQLGAWNYREHQITLYPFLVTMLDKADRWEEYLAAWDGIRANTDLCFTYSGGSLATHGARMAPLALCPDGGRPKEQPGFPARWRDVHPREVLQVHFLYVQAHRKELIERKLARQRAGHKMGNFRHETAGT